MHFSKLTIYSCAFLSVTTESVTLSGLCLDAKIRALSHGAIFVATCNAILLLEDVKLAKCIIPSMDPNTNLTMFVHVQKTSHTVLFQILIKAFTMCQLSCNSHDKQAMLKSIYILQNCSLTKLLTNLTSAVNPCIRRVSP